MGPFSFLAIFSVGRNDIGQDLRHVFLTAPSTRTFSEANPLNPYWVQLYVLVVVDLFGAFWNMAGWSMPKRRSGVDLEEPRLLVFSLQFGTL